MEKSFGQQLRLLGIFLRGFTTFIIVAVSAFLFSTTLLYFVYPRSELPLHQQSYLSIAYDVMLMTFFEQPIPFVDDWRLVPVFFGLPILGLLVIADGVVKLGHLILQRQNFTREWQEMIAESYENHIIVCGLGNVGQRVADYLLSFGEQLVCIERKADFSASADFQNRKIPVLIGDSSNPLLLEQANAKKAKAIMILTDQDLANLDTALTAKEMAPNIRVVMRMFDQTFADKVKTSFGIDSVFSASALSAPVFAQAALSNNILSSFSFGDKLINAFQLEIKEGSHFINEKIDDVRRKHEATIIMHQRRKEVDWNPPPDLVLASGDKLLIVTDRENLPALLSAEKGAKV
ncbi:MAG: TrkA family potassium uptake protein [Candidatus Melainabacteria bacterium]|nr:TrkA family potassium uptake protein [Candidatus Melainabacteria bacterium]